MLITAMENLERIFSVKRWWLSWLIVILLTLSFLYSPTSAFANRFIHISPRSIAMGGAYVAIADDALSYYYNPAGTGLFKKNSWSIKTPYGYCSYDYNNFEDKLKETLAVDPMDAWSDPSSAETLAKNILELPGDHSHIYGSGHFGLMVATTGFSMSVLRYDYALFYPNIDSTRLNPTNPMEDPNSIAGNNSKLAMSGYSVTEYGLSFSNAGVGVLWGVSIKNIAAMTYYDEVYLWDYDYQNADEAYRDALKKNRRYTNTYGVDFGIIAPFGGGRLGAVWKNINQPDFMYSGRGDLYLRPQVRLGYVLSPAPGFMLAIDYDIRKNRSRIIGATDRQLSVGVEKSLGEYLTVRFGFYQNVAQASDPIYSTGMGINISGLTVDIAVQFGEIVSQQRLSISAGLKF